VEAADRGGAARAPQRGENRRLHCRDAAHRRASQTPAAAGAVAAGMVAAGDMAAVAVGRVVADTSEALADMAAGLAGTAAE